MVVAGLVAGQDNWSLGLGMSQGLVFLHGYRLQTVQAYLVIREQETDTGTLSQLQTSI